MNALLWQPPLVSSRRLLVRNSSERKAAAARVSPVKDGWSKFANRVSGEWSGCAVDFDRNGKPVAVPPELVPAAYKEWGVEVHDWETYCATLVDDGTRGFYNKTLRLYPTSGCGATEASIYSTEEQNLDSAGQEFFAFHPSGSFIAVWKKSFGKVIPVLEVEHCLVADGNEGSRVRLLQKLEMATLTPVEITAYKESWEEPFRSGQSVVSCLTTHGAFAGNPRTDRIILHGPWRVVRFSFSSPHDVSPRGFHRLSLNEEDATTFHRSTTEGFTLLPDGLWSKIERKGNGNIVVEAGWLVERPATAVVSRCELSSSSDVQRAELETQYRETYVERRYAVQIS